MQARAIAAMSCEISSDARTLVTVDHAGEQIEIWPARCRLSRAVVGSSAMEMSRGVSVRPIADHGAGGVPPENS